MDLSVCIVSWNTKDLLRKCIQSILDKTAGLDYEIIVVDNDSKDGSLEMVRQEYPPCKVINSGQNLGFARANNLAVLHASGKYILYLNPDTEFETNALYGMYDCLEKNQTYGALGCKLIYPDGSLQYTCARAFTTPLNEFCELAMLYRIFPKSPFFSTVEMYYWDHESSREVDCISGACIMARKTIIDGLGGFDEEYFMYAEDVDLCYRIRKAGWKIYYLAQEKIIHHEGASSKKKPNKHYSTVQIRDSNVLFFKKNFGLFTIFMYRAAVLIGSAIRIGVIPLYILAMKIAGADNIPNGLDLLNKYTVLIKWSMGKTTQITN